MRSLDKLVERKPLNTDKYIFTYICNIDCKTEAGEVHRDNSMYNFLVM